MGGKPKNSFKILVPLAFIILFFLSKIWIVFSESNLLLLKNVYILSKSDTLSEGITKISDNKISVNSVNFHKVGDYIQYSVKMENNKNEKYILKSISDDNKNRYVSYAYNKYEDIELDSGKTFDFVFTETYSKELEDISQRTQNFSVNFYFTLENNQGNILKQKLNLNKNPSTGDNLKIYIIPLVILCILAVIILKKVGVKNTKKHGMKFFILLIALCLAFSPQIARGLSNELFKWVLENKVELKDKLLVSYDVCGELGTKVVAYDTKANIDTPSREGYVFKGWKTEGGDLFDENSPIKDDIKLEAVFEASTYQIIYNLSGGYADNPKNYTIEDEIQIRNPLKMGYTFEGWTGTELDSITTDVIIRRGSSGDRIYDAHWIPNKYTIVFDSNGGEGNMEPQTIEYDVSENLFRNVFVKENAIFLGWNTEPSGNGISYIDEAVIKNLAERGNITLYAQWSDIDDWALFVAGKKLNSKMKQLAGNDGANFDTVDNNVNSVERSFDAPEPEFINEQNIVSAPDSPHVIYMWYDDGTIRYYSDAKIIYLNPVSESAFEKFSALKSIDVDNMRTDKVVDMSKMFYDCVFLENLKLSNFITKNATNMFGMFSHCRNLRSLDLRSFNTSNVTDMSSMFNQCNSATSIDVSSFDTSNVKDMNRMFTACISLSDLNVSNFRTNNVTNMEKMFDNIPLIKSINLDTFDTSNVAKMNGMFRNCLNLETLDLSSFSTSNVTTMEQMFEGCQELVSVFIEPSKFKTDNVRTMKQMFYKCYMLDSFNFSGFNTSNVQSMSGMLSSCKSIRNIDLGSFNTSNVDDMSSMFNQCNAVISINVSSFDTSSVKNLNRMFSSCSLIEKLDVSAFNTDNVSDMEKMFDNMSSLKTIYASENFSTNNVVNGANMFINDINLVGGNGTVYDRAHVGYTYARIDMILLPGYFTRKS